MRPILRPGTHVLSRGAGELQVGLDPRTALVLPDSPPVRDALRLIAVGWAARDVAAYVDGHRPSTWSSTLTLHAGEDGLESQAWLRHPGCSCTWD